MKAKNSFFLFTFLSLIAVFVWLDTLYLVPDVKYVLFGHYLVHCIALYYSSKELSDLKFPFVLFISLVNIITFFYAPAIIDPQDFQLGTLNYEVLSDLLIGYIIFYTIYFFLSTIQLRNIKWIKPKQQNLVYRKDAFKRLKILFLVLYIVQLLFEFPISGLNDFIELFTIGLYMIGFLLNINSKLENLLFIGLISFQSLKVVTSGLIFTIIYFAIYLIVLFKNYGLQSRKGKYFIGSLLAIYLIFSILFSSVKMEYRTYKFTSNSILEKVKVIYTLVTEQQNSTDVQSFKEQTKQGPVWRLSYPLSAISLVKEKTPSTIPYWKGESYFPIFTKFIPRFIWPDKPTENMGQEFGHRYGILAWDNLTTSMNTPVVAEAYMNFGEIGFYFIFFFMAVVIAKVYIKQNRTQSQDRLSVDTIVNTITIAIATVYFTQWESNLTMMIGKFIILYVTTKLIRRFIIQA
ncbi:MAG: hypothetical protein RLZ39_1097 [Bacteroidota bacterium]|jgi:hypothetical protein